MVPISSPTRLSEYYKKFIRRGVANRILVHDEKGISQEEFSDSMVKYFKENNDRYLELINMEIKK